MCADVKTWICDLYSIDEDEEDSVVLINQAMPSAISNNSLWTKVRKHPDVTVYDPGLDAELILQIEVDSGDRDSTIFVLVLGLTDQSRYYDSTISSGFYFPVGDGFIERVDCAWNDAKLNYENRMYNTTSIRC